MRVGLIGMRQLPEPDIDEAPALAALREAGVDARVVHWGSDHPEHDPARFDACVIRATWDYYRRPDEFVAWLRRASESTVLRNPVSTVEWNIHKGYLLELAAAGVPVVPTSLVMRGSGTGAPGVPHAGDGLVIKPAISAASWKTRRFAPDELREAAAYVAQETHDRDMLVQPFMGEVERGGEIALVWIDGELTHGIRKHPRFDGHEESVERAEIEDRHRAFAERVLRAAGREALFARVDVIETDDGLLLSELELIEPSLYFPFSSSALSRFVRAVTSTGDS